MIKYHPDPAVLKDFVDGELSPSVSILVSSHIEMCSECQKRVEELTEVASTHCFSEGNQIDDPDWFENTYDYSSQDSDLAMIDAITSQPSEPEFVSPQTITEIDLGGERISLPRAMKSISLKEWQRMGKISRSRLDFQDEQRKMSLLHIAEGGSVPTHTHKGFEITLLLQGSFEDELGHYSAGDFLWLDNEHTHQPVSHEGCVCLTVSSDAMQFTQGLTQILNPLGKFIY
ncbi:transcriptional regulator [Vibrio sp. T187]|uniref:ChrR family anti-sigma-E factor n=1 Tax=Vibrio TaxID=662 RepID=UPI0010C98DA4|nr:MULTISPECIES: ChrR family anti-sigma-E factor [Vibrio]MBW3696893.1 transcriptional regulator [Vibrio sp. T187]